MERPRKFRPGPQFWLVGPLILGVLIMVGIRLWSGRPGIGADGSFRTITAPLVPLVFEFEHNDEKYLPVRQEIDPTLTDEVVVALQPNPAQGDL
jgi:hypothetical protein